MVKIRKSKSIMLKGKEDTIMGVWVAHKEGQFKLKSHDYKNTENMHHVTPIQYVNDNGMPTDEYPFNPNGSMGGITAVCSDDGGHLAMMPHPERCFMSWQLPWTPDSYPMEKYEISPWAAMFYNAYEWCASNVQSD